ncbi:aminotransferase class V-fold PLP-dependent enzyme [Actinomycetospora sp. TBRC 11914]|uniref:kynureninase n=1 Tax=Actinomycetospora sp. TBRC 11914 TaxID=2729387 RepID=UPI00145C489C|nr:aminotransferase class V-fold PLP-dependent enzyme [Actinomycetospora sp. TBRC 11914]NMO88788.1 aminotransferase class V-fold PLP-dependent enzyme [Actinomycetospora sp. TBRC 11914]
MTTPDVGTRFAARAAELDAADPLRPLRDRFVLAGDVVAYFDGNSLGRPLRVTGEALAAFTAHDWGERLIRSWDEEVGASGATGGGWVDLPAALGDRLGALLLGAAPGQTLLGDSTSVWLYKLARAAVDAADPARDEIVLSDDDFPTDRYLLEGIAAETGRRLRWIPTDPAGGVSPEQVAAAVGPRTALVVLSHVAYRSGFLADAATITGLVHDAGALVCWDLCHSVGSVPVALDAWGADLAVGCTYKYLGGGPGSPAFAYVAARHHEALRQPVQGWFGRADQFAMAAGYVPAPGVRRFLSGTPPVLALVPVRAGLDVYAEAGIGAVRAKSEALTAFAVEIADEVLAPLGVELASPRDPARRGGHVTLRHPDAEAVVAECRRRGVVPDFRAPDGIRVGLAPLSTSFTEVAAGLSEVRSALVSTNCRYSDS